MKKIVKICVLLLVIIIIANIWLPIHSLAVTKKQTMIKPIQANGNGIEAFPQSYQTLLKKLVNTTGHTNWKFQAFYTDIDWNELISNETIHLTNTIALSDSYPSSWYCSCHKQGDVGYYCASKEIISYYLDPRNFLTEPTIFQFLNLSNTTEVSVSQIEKAVEQTFLDGSANGMRYAQMIYDAAKASGENAYSIICKIFQELGRGKKGELPEVVSGKDTEYPNTYNFFNYGATDGENNRKRALAFAAQEGWNTPYKAMVEGAKKIASNYLQQGQNTKYTFKFDIVGNDTSEMFSHQYMTNIEDPLGQALNLYDMYNANGLLNQELTFIIPVYKNMPTYVKLPSTETGNLGYVSSNATSVYLRNGPGGVGSGYTNIMALRKDTIVQILQTGINGWTKVSYQGIVGYMAEQYVTPVNLKKDVYQVPNSSELPFEDVSADEWYYEAIRYTYQKGIIKGANDTEFKPNTKISRGMMVTILWRMVGEPKVTGGKNFPDVKTNDYYYYAVKWASAKGIVNGYNSGKFAPNDDITREQLAVILQNYSKYMKRDVSKTTNLSKFKDGYKTTGYAQPAVKWAVATGVISGKDKGTRLDPQGTATRAEASAMIYNYFTKIKGDR